MDYPIEKRYLTHFLESLALQRGKMAFLSGPRQAGKTTLGKNMLKTLGQGHYYTWDDIEFRRLWTKTPKRTILNQDDPVSLYVYDEIHKAARWKGTLKGIYDTLENPKKSQILVTGSARLDVYRKGGDSLLGRYLHFRLHPFSVGELLRNKALDPDKVLENVLSSQEASGEALDAFNRLFQFGGFPEPLLEANEELGVIWRRGRLEKIIREDLRDLSRLPELSQVEMLVSLLEEKVGGLLSVESLREDLEVAHSTTQRWLNYLQQLYYCYVIRPYHRSIPRSLKKEPKLYLWDWSEVQNPGARFENLIAGHLLKACHFWTDIGKGNFDLFYLRDKEKNEIDFLVTKNRTPWLAVEVKSKDMHWSPAFKAFRSRVAIPVCLQVVQQNIEPKSWSDSMGTCLTLGAASFLNQLP